MSSMPRITSCSNSANRSHAFDLDNVTDQTIIVRRAREGERFTTLDGVERTLTNAMLVIADARACGGAGGHHGRGK